MNDRYELITVRDIAHFYHVCLFNSPTIFIILYEYIQSTLGVFFLAMTCL